MDHDFERQLADAVRQMNGQSGVDETMGFAVSFAPHVIDGCDMAGVSVITKDGIDTLAATDSVLEDAEQLQFTMGEGPCFDALDAHEHVYSKDLATDTRWPTWGQRVAAELGLHSSVSYRLFTSKGTLGSLDLYSHRTEAFGTDAIHEGVALAAHVAVALARAQYSDGMRTALHGRTVIGQAQGILMERFALSADQAFNVLIRYSQTHNIRIRQLSEQIVETRALPEND